MAGGFIRTVALNDVEIHGFHGLYDFEREEGNTFLVNLNVSFRVSPVSEAAEMEHTVNYEHLLQLVEHHFSGSELLLETLCDRIILDIVQLCPAAVSAMVSVKKKNPPLRGRVDSSEVSVRYTAD